MMGMMMVLLIFFSTFFEQVIPGFNYWDEVMVVAILGLGIFKYKKLIIGKYDAVTIGILAIIVLIGICGNLCSPNLQPSILAILKDIYAIIKFPVTILLISRLFTDYQKERYLHVAEQISRWLTLVIMGTAIVGYFIDIGVYINDLGRMMKTFMFVFSHPTFLVSSTIMLTAILMSGSIKQNRWYIFLCAFILFLSQRSKAYFAVAIILIILLFREENLIRMFAIRKKKTVLKKRYIVILLLAFTLVAVTVVGSSKMNEYLKWGMSAARPALYITGLEIMRDFFPLGSGFATFASSLSGEYYSNIYNLYGLSDVWGLMPTWYSYMGDVFWPYIYGQFGIMGMVLYAWLMVRIFKSGLSLIREPNKILAFSLVWAYALFASTAEAYFTNGTAMQMAITLGIFVSSSKLKGRSVNNESSSEKNN